MNVILTYKKIKDFDEYSDKELSKIQFTQIPEMKVLETFIKVDDKEVTEHTIPYQANATTKEFNSLKEMLELFGEVYIIGKWNDDGSKIECDSTKYKNALKDIQVFDKVNVMGVTEDEYGIEKEVVIRTYTGIKESRRPTLAESKKIQVNTFNVNITREL